MKKSIKHFKISKPEDLKQAFDVEEYGDIRITLENDIVLDENDSFEPIDFNGKNVYINGNNYTIYNLNINLPKSMEVGLIKRANNLLVKNLNIINAKIISGEVSGTLVGRVDNDLILRNVGIDSKIESDAISGGICGIAKNILSQDVTINAKVFGRGVLGGVAGMSDTYKEKQTKIKCHLKSKYAKMIHDTATNKKVGYLSSERETTLQNMVKQAYRSMPVIISEEEIELLRLKLNI